MENVAVAVNLKNLNRKLTVPGIVPGTEDGSGNREWFRDKKMVP